MIKISKYSLTHSLTLALLLGCASSFVKTAYASRDCQPCDKDRQCSSNPLYCDGFNLSFYAGPSPIIWTSRGCINFLNTPAVTSSSNVVSLCSDASGCDASPACSTPSPCVASVASCGGSNNCSFNAANSIAAIEIPKFSRMFGTPWTVGADLGYAITENHEVLLEANYTQASNKREYIQAFVTNAAGRTVLVQPNFVAKYKNVSGYVGYRYNFDRGCRFLGSSVSWFLAAKAGFIHHFNIRGFVNSSLTTSIVDGSVTPFFPIFKSNTAFSGAAEVGVDVCLNCDWSLLIGAEVAATWGPGCKQHAAAVTELVTNNVAVGKVGAEILFPVTVGLRYKF